MLLKTKGDNNPESYEGIDYPIAREDYYGKVIAIIPKIWFVEQFVDAIAFSI